VAFAAAAHSAGRSPAPPVRGRQAAGKPVRAGEVLRTGAGSGITLESNRLGSVEPGPDLAVRAARGSPGGAAPRRDPRLHPGAHRGVRAGHATGACGGSRMRVHDPGGPVGRRAAAGDDGLGGVGVAGQGSFIPAGAVCAIGAAERAGHSLLRGRAGNAARGRATERLRGSAAGVHDGKAARQRGGLALRHLLTRVPERLRGWERKW